MGSRRGQACPSFKIPTAPKRGIAAYAGRPRWLQDPSFGRGMSSFGPNRAGHRTGGRGHPAQGALGGGVRRLVPGGGRGPGPGPAAEGLDQPAQKQRRLETASVQLRDAHGWTLKLPGPHLAVEELVPLIPARPIAPSPSASTPLVLHAGRPHPRPGQGPHRGEL